MLGAVALFTACSDDGGSGNGNINYEEGYKYLSFPTIGTNVATDQDHPP